jgi:hypothetical protein
MSHLRLAFFTFLVVAFGTCFLLLIWCITYIDFQMLNQPCIPGTNPTWQWYIILFIWCWIWFGSFCVCFCGTGVCTQGLVLARKTLCHKNDAPTPLTSFYR